MGIKLLNLPSVLPKPDYGKVVQQAIEHPFQKATSESFRTAQFNAGVSKLGLTPKEAINLGAKFKSAGAGAETVNLALIARFKKLIAEGKLTEEAFEKFVKAGNMGNNSEATINAIRKEFAKAKLPVAKTVNLPAVSNFKKAAQTAGSGTKSLPVPVNPEQKGFIRGLWDKLKAFAKTPKGKIGLAAAALTTLIGTGAYLYVRNKDYGGPVSDSSPINDLATLPVNGQMSASGPYTVAKGDNIWCIARSHLMELHKGEKDYKPTDVEILQRTEEIMQLNNLQYEKDSYRVIIQPNQSLKLTA